MPLSLLDNAQDFLLLVRSPNNPLGQRTTLARLPLLARVQHLLDAQLSSADVEASLKVISQFGQGSCAAQVRVVTARFWRRLFRGETVAVRHLWLLCLLRPIDGRFRGRRMLLDGRLNWFQFL